MTAAMTTQEPQFLYPTSRQFPFDEVCEQIVRALEARNWTVPGISVEFDVYGSGDAKYRLVREVRTAKCRLRFGRPQGRLGRYNDTAAISTLSIPKRELHVYDDESGPSYYVYVGKRWWSDRKPFHSSSKVNSKLRGEPRTYLRYKGACACNQTSGASFGAIELLTASLTGDRKKLAALTHHHSGRRAPLLVHDNDLGREYDPRGKEPTSYVTAEVFAEFTSWLQHHVLRPILATPEATERLDHFSQSTTPWPDSVGPIFCFGEAEDAQRVYAGQHDLEATKPEARYGFSGSGYRLVRLGGGSRDVPKVAYDGFLWCTFGEVTPATAADTLEVPGHYRHGDREHYVFRITPKHADGVYVADHAVFEQTRTQLFAAIAPRDRLTDEELAEADRARGKSIVPITQYDGRYEQPIVLINRELDFDEVELVSGPWPLCEYVGLIAGRSPAARALLEQAISAQQTYYEHYTALDRAACEQAIADLTRHFADDPALAEAAQAYARHRYHETVVDDHFLTQIVYAALDMRRLGLF